MGYPVCLFGEDAGDRRERLRSKVVEDCIEKGEPPTFLMRISGSEAGKNGDVKNQQEIFYTEGEEGLKEARLIIAKYSLPRA